VVRKFILDLLCIYFYLFIFFFFVTESFFMLQEIYEVGDIIKDGGEG